MASPIGIMQMRSPTVSGGSNPTVAMGDYTINGGTSGDLRIKPDGNAYKSIDAGADTLLGAWLTSGLAADVEVMATRTGTGSITGSNTLGQWFPLTADVVYRIGSSGTPRNSVFSITFRNKFTLATLDTATVTIDLTG